MGQRAPRVFVSYSSKDLPVARGIVVQLRGLGFEVWFDKDEIRPGFLFRDAIRDGIERSDCFVLLVSRHYLAGEFCRMELATTRAFGFNVTVPVLLDDCWELALTDTTFASLGGYIAVECPQEGGVRIPTDAFISRLAQGFAEAARDPWSETPTDPVDYVVCSLHQDAEFATLVAEGLRALGVSVGSVWDQGLAGENISQLMYRLLRASKYCVFVLSTGSINAASIAGQFAVASEEMRLPLLAVVTPDLSRDARAFRKVTKRISARDRVFSRITDRQLFLSDRPLAEVCRDIVAAAAAYKPTDNWAYPWHRMRDVLQDLGEYFGRPSE